MAGGRGRRLGGRAKWALPLGDTTLLERQLGVLREVVDHLLIVTTPEAIVENRDVPVVFDLIQGAGAMGGVLTAVSFAPTDRTLVIACDMPFLSTAFIRHLVERGETADNAVPRTNDGLHPLCATYSRRCGARLAGRVRSGALKMTDFIEHAEGLSISEIGAGDVSRFDPDSTLLFNINTPDDYARALDAEARRESVLAKQRHRAAS